MGDLRYAVVFVTGAVWMAAIEARHTRGGRSAVRAAERAIRTRSKAAAESA